jgi:hypothetical protein
MFVTMARTLSPTLTTTLNGVSPEHVELGIVTGKDNFKTITDFVQTRIIRSRK